MRLGKKNKKFLLEYTYIFSERVILIVTPYLIEYGIIYVATIGI